MEIDPFDQRPQLITMTEIPKLKLQVGEFSLNLVNLLAPEEVAAASFPRGQHPLEGVPNIGELPTPEELKGLSKYFFPFNFFTQLFRDSSDSAGITSLLGDYRARCLFSKVWALREAGLIKTRLLLPDFKKDPGLVPSLGAIVATIKNGINDKIAQVFAASIALLDDVLTSLAK